MPDARLPETVGLCPYPDHAAEFYYPDPQPGERCPADDGVRGCDGVLVHYTRHDELAAARRADADVFVEAVRWALGGALGPGRCPPDPVLREAAAIVLPRIRAKARREADSGAGG